MALRDSMITLPVDGGLDEKTSKFFKAPPAADELVNVRFDKNGDIRCRPGFGSVNPADSDNLRFIQASSDKAVCFDNDRMRSFNGTSWNNEYSVSPTIRTYPVAYERRAVAYYDDVDPLFGTPKCVTLRGATYTVAITKLGTGGSAGGLFMSAFLNSTGRVVFRQELASDAYDFQGATTQSGENFGVCWTDSSNNLKIARIYVPTSLISTTTHTTAAPSLPLDVKACNAITGVNAAFVTWDGYDVVGFQMSDAGAVTEFTYASGFGSGVADFVDICTHTSNGAGDDDGYVLVMARSSSGYVRWQEFDTTMAVDGAAYTGTDIITNSMTQLAVVQCHDPQQSAADRYLIFVTKNGRIEIYLCDESGLIQQGSPVTASSMYSKPFKHPTMDVVLIALLPLGNISNKTSSSGAKLCHVEKVASNTYRAIPLASFAVFNGAGKLTGYTQPTTYGDIVEIGTGSRLLGRTTFERHVFDFDPDYLPKTEFRNALYFGCGDLRYFDGSLRALHNPNAVPYITSVAKTGAASGSYSVRVVAKYTDVNGDIRRSPASNTITGTLGVTSNVYSVYFPDCFQPLTSSPGDEISFEVYRTDNAGAVFYLSGRITDITYQALTGYFDITETYTATLAGNALLEDQSEVATSITPVPRWLGTFDGRICMIPAEAPTEFWYSKLKNQGVSPNFSAALRVSFGSEEELTCGAVLDDKVVLFTASSAYVLYGSGPGNNGSGSTYQKQKINIGVGTSNPNSVVSGPFGVIFLADSGFWILDRSLQPSFIGAKVDGLEGTITSSLIDPVNHEVIFGKADGALVYNYLYGKWSTWDECDIKDLAMYDGDVMFVDADPDTNGIDIGKFTSTATASGNYAKPTLTYTSPWISFGAVGGIKRVRRVQFLFDELDAAYDGDITITSYYDYDASSSDTETFTGAVWSALPLPRQLEYELPVQVCESVRFRVELKPGASTNPGLSLGAMRVRVASKRGFAGLPAGARV